MRQAVILIPLFMATLKLGALITQISGKLGGQVLGTSRNGSYIKTNAYSVNKGTQKQQLQQSKIGSVTTFWGNIPPSEKNNWETETANYPYVNRVGDLVEYTAYQLFLKLNTNLVLIDQPIITIAPVFVSVLAPILDFKTLTVASMIMEYTGALVTDDIVIYATPSLSPGSTNPDKHLRKIFTSTARTPVFQTDYINEYVKVFSAPKLGSRIFLAVKAVNFTTGNSTEIGGSVSLIVGAFIPGVGSQVIGTSNIIG